VGFAVLQKLGVWRLGDFVDGMGQYGALLVSFLAFLSFFRFGFGFLLLLCFFYFDNITIVLSFDCWSFFFLLLVLLFLISRLFCLTRAFIVFVF